MFAVQYFKFSYSSICSKHSELFSIRTICIKV